MNSRDQRANKRHELGQPKPPPIGPGSRVRLVNVFQAAGGLSSTEVYTVERVEDQGGKVVVFLVGDDRPWKPERFTAEPK